MSSPKVRDRFLKKLFSDEELEERFRESLRATGEATTALLWTKERPEHVPFRVHPPLEWQPDFVDVVSKAEQPGSHELHHQGFYYCLDLSSIFAASVLTAVAPRDDVTLLDLCASPGGKTVAATRFLECSTIVANETIRKRIKPLVSNLRRCEIGNVEVLGHDPARIAELYPDAMNVVIVDAPCSGQSLLFKDIDVQGCFHPMTIGKNASRQRRILMNGSKCVAPNGYVAYMTCTFAREENEEIIEWLVEERPGFEPIEVPRLKNFQSPFASFPCYRLLPWQGGAGAFTALLRRSG